MMLTCPRCALAVLVLLLVAFTGCDTNNGGGRSLDDLAGEYVLEELIFDPSTSSLPEADVGARLNLDGTSLEIFGNGDEALLRSQFRGRATRRTDLTVRALSNAIEFTAVTADDEDDLTDLFLPRTFRLSFTSTTSRELRAEPELFLDDVNLQAFDPDLYEDQTSNRGRLRVVFRRP